MLSIPLLLLSIYAAAVFETALAGWIEVRHVAPDLLALVAVIWLLVTNRPRGFLVAAGIGLLSDLTSAGPVGIGAATLAIVGFGVASLRSRMDFNHLLVQLGVVLAAVTAVALGEGAAWRLTSETTLAWSTLAVRGVTIGVYTTAVALPVLLLMYWRRRPRIKVAVA